MAGRNSKESLRRSGLQREPGTQILSNGVSHISLMRLLPKTKASDFHSQRPSVCATEMQLDLHLQLSNFLIRNSSLLPLQLPGHCLRISISDPVLILSQRPQPRCGQSLVIRSCHTPNAYEFNCHFGFQL